MSQPAYGFGFGIEGQNGKYEVNGKKKEAGGYGASLKEDYRYFYGAGVGMGGRGEAIPLESNYCEIDPNVVDQFGIPVLRFNVKWSDHEIKQAKHMKETFKEIMHNMGAVITGAVMMMKKITGACRNREKLYMKPGQCVWVTTQNDLP